MKTENSAARHLQFAEDIIADLRRKSPGIPYCWIACYEDRPLQGNPPGSGRPHLLIFNSRFRYEAFVSARRQVFAAEPLSAVAVDTPETLLDLLMVPARDGRYSPPPLGLLLNFTYPSGKAEQVISPDRVMEMDASQLAEALHLGGQPRRKLDRKAWFAILAAAILIPVCGSLVYLQNRERFSPAPSTTSTMTVTPLPTPTQIVLDSPACTAIGETWTRPSDGAKMVCVPAGEFLMGSTEAEIAAAIAECSGPLCKKFSNEAPQHTVILDAYWIDQTEVTNAQYLACVSAGVCGWTRRYSDVAQDKPDLPVAGVTGENARTYAAWVGGRLPTEAEWEKAARGTDGRIYPWGNNPPDCSLANIADCQTGLVAVGSYPAGASPYGALDMAGNVWEWVADWYAEDYYVSSPERNPQGPETGADGILRGGALGEVWYARSACRSNFPPGNGNQAIGFRVVVPAGSSAP
jgi:formylglycine-generating enzyme required for sulfatase activity